MTTDFAPTDEQLIALDLFSKGTSLAIEAGAGAGKTSTLKLLAESTKRRGQFVAFNKAITVEAGAKMPSNVACSTAHSLAYRAVGHRYRNRLNSPRVRSDQIARHLGLGQFNVSYGGMVKVMQPGRLAGITMRAIGKFCQTPDEEITVDHFPYIDGIDEPYDDGRRRHANNDEIRRYLLPAARRAWADLVKTEGVLKFGHDHYLKIWALSHPRILVDFLLIDEAQDLNPLLMGVASEQTDHAQLVLVGDSQQAIYGFTGAVNALAKTPCENRAFLSRSFRFGPAIAEVANVVLDELEAELRLTGAGPADSVVEAIENPDAILCRTNAMAVSTVMSAQARGRQPHLVGGGSDVLDFAKAAGELMEGRRTYHPDLACFDTWGEVEDYCANDQLGGDLRLMVKLVTDYGVDSITSALGRMPQESRADLIVSTAHRGKGREWDTVQLAGDFSDEAREQPDELRLLYVAATRARQALDVSHCAPLVDLLDPPPPEPPPAPTPPVSEAVPVQPAEPEPEDARALTLLYGTRVSG